MAKLLHLPRDIWFDRITPFIRLRDLVRVDTAVTNNNDRNAFHECIDGCQRYPRSSINTLQEITWRSFHNILPEEVTFERKSAEEMYNPNLKNYLSLAKTMSLNNIVLSMKNLKSMLEYVKQVVENIYIFRCRIHDVIEFGICMKLTSIYLSDVTFERTEAATILADCVHLKECYLFNTPISTDTISAVLNNCFDLTLLRIENCSINMNEALRNVRGPLSLTDFICLGRVHVFGGGMYHLAQILPNIETLLVQETLAPTPTTDEEMDFLARNCSKLTTLSLAAFSKLTNATLISVVTHLPLLTSLTINCCHQMSGVGVRAATMVCSRLQSLHLIGLSIDDGDLQDIGQRCSELRDVSVMHCNALTDAAFNTFNPNSLRVVNVTGTRVTGGFAAMFPELHCITNYDGFHTTDILVDNIPANSSLTTFRMNHSNITRAGWLQLSTKLTKLRLLDIEHNTYVDETVVRSFIKHNPKLIRCFFSSTGMSDALYTDFTWLTRR